MKKNIKKLLQYSLSNTDINHVFKPNKINIIEYQNLSKYQHIDDLFNNSSFNNKCVLFMPENLSGNIGHWLCIMKHKNGKYEYFDSYKDPDDNGVYEPDEEPREWLSEKLRKHLNIDRPVLTDLFLRSGVNSVICNPYPFQMESPLINDCGRHVCCRLLHSNLSLKQYWNMIKKSGMNPDDFVTNYIYNIIHK